MDVQVVTHEVRLQKWISIVETCRGSGKTIKAWCAENGINLKSYYYWQRKVCLETCREITTVQKFMPEIVSNNGKTVFAELSIPENNTGKIAVNVQRDNMQINVFSGADASTIEIVFEALRKL